MKKKTSILTLGAVAGLVAMFGVVIGATVSAEGADVVDQVDITVPVSCTMSGVGMNTHNANINNGIYTADVGTTTMHVFCNDAEGFAIYAAGYTGNEVGGANSNKLVGTSASNNATIDTGLATTAGNPDVSNWAMKLTMTQDSGDTTGTNAFTVDSAPNLVNGTLAGESVSFSQYHTVPNEYTKIAHKNSGTDMTANTGGVKLTTTYAAYISKTQPADTYSGQVKYILMHPSTVSAPGFYTIVYNANGGSGTMSNDRALTLEPFTLKTNEYIGPNNASFLGWCTTNTSQFECLDGDSYDDGASVLGLTSANGTINLYAYWDITTFDKAMSDAGKTKLNGYYKIQDVTPGICNAVERLQIGQVIDSRDNEVYYIGKLYNGRCWMLDNLRLGGSSTILLTADDTNISTNYTLPASTASINSYASSQLNASYKNDVAPVTFGSASGKVGVYYNYCAATAGTFCYSEEPDRDSSVYDVCPLGWRLPTGYSSGEFRGGARESLSTPLSGVYTTTQTDLGSKGVFWSSYHSVFENYGTRYVLTVDQNYYYNTNEPVNMDDRNRGLSIRCILSQ